MHFDLYFPPIIMIKNDQAAFDLYFPLIIMIKNDQAAFKELPPPMLGKILSIKQP